MPVYGFIKNTWLVNFCNDRGLALSMEGVGAEIFEASNKKYWRIGDTEKFSKIEPLLRELGYQKFQDEKEAAEQTYTVPQINDAIGKALKKDVPGQYWVRGEIAELSIRQHVYFKLLEVDPQKPTDKLQKLQAVIWSRKWQEIKARAGELRDGQEIRVCGTVQYYGYGGTLSFHIDEIDAEFAEGEFYKRKAAILAELGKLGILNCNLTLPMPALPLRIALFSSPQAAGYGDFINILTKAGYPYRITNFTVALQGKNVEQSFLEAFGLLEKIGVGQFDLGVVIRGGGAITDLAAFNNFKIAECIARSPLKFFIGIGHDRDRTVLDEIAARAITPTDIANILNRQMEIQENCVNVQLQQLKQCAARALVHAEADLKMIAYRCSGAVAAARSDVQHTLDLLIGGLRAHPRARLRELSVRFTGFEDAIVNKSGMCLNIRRVECESLKNNLRMGASKIKDVALRDLMMMSKQLRSSVMQRLTIENGVLKQLEARIQMSDPRQCLAKGYAVVQDCHGNRISSIDNVGSHDKLSIRLADGKLQVSVDGVKRDDGV